MPASAWMPLDLSIGVASPRGVQLAQSPALARVTAFPECTNLPAGRILNKGRYRICIERVIKDLRVLKYQVEVFGRLLRIASRSSIMH